MKNEFPKRKPLRLQSYDYSSPGAYFITICTHNRKCTLSHIVGAIHESPVNELTEYGNIIKNVVEQLPKHFNTAIDSYVIMPNHIHLILTINNDAERAIRESPLQTRSAISKTVGYIKMVSSKEIHLKCSKTTVWQRGFHDHIIRNRKDYEEIAKYIYENPFRWQYDCFYTNQ